MLKNMNHSGLRQAALPALLILCAAASAAQQPLAPKSAAQGKPDTQEQRKADEHKMPAERGDVVDRIVAIVNGDLVLESDVEEEERFTKLYPYTANGNKPLREEAITRLIDRALIRQQESGFPLAPVTDEQVSEEEQQLRKDLPGCAHTDCSSEAGWKSFLEKQGFTEDELKERLRMRISALHFIEQRFRAGIRISDQQIEDYYNKTMLPEYQRQHANAPPLDSVHDRIEEVLLQQEVSSLLDQWLKTLRDSGNVRMMQPGVEAP